MWLATTGGLMICLLMFVIVTVTVSCAIAGAVPAANTATTAANIRVRFMILFSFQISIVEVMTNSIIYKMESRSHVPVTQTSHFYPEEGVRGLGG